MYWSGTDYDRMAQLVIDIYVDYNIRSFPVDEKEICRKLGLKLIPYSEYPEEQEALLRKRSMDAFFAPATRTTFTMIKSNHAEGFDTTYFMRSNTL